MIRTTPLAKANVKACFGSLATSERRPTTVEGRSESSGSGGAGGLPRSLISKGHRSMLLLQVRCSGRGIPNAASLSRSLRLARRHRVGGALVLAELADALGDQISRLLLGERHTAERLEVTNEGVYQFFVVALH